MRVLARLEDNRAEIARRQTKFRPREYAATKSKVEPERQRKLITTGCPITAVVPMSADGTKLPTWDVRPTVAIGGKADEMCSG
jgi:hypothetical protein